MTTNIEIFVGTYDSYLLSYKLLQQNGVSNLKTTKIIVYKRRLAPFILT